MFVLMVLLREKTLNLNTVLSLNSYAKCGNNSCVYDSHRPASQVQGVNNPLLANA